MCHTRGLSPCGLLCLVSSLSVVGSGSVPRVHGDTSHLPAGGQELLPCIGDPLCVSTCPSKDAWAVSAFRVP